jgi:hypothetical protein
MLERKKKKSRVENVKGGIDHPLEITLPSSSVGINNLRKHALGTPCSDVLTFREEKYGISLEETNGRAPGPGLVSTLGGGIITKAFKAWEEAYLLV